jgi:hypothetical protein
MSYSGSRICNQEYNAAFTVAARDFYSLAKALSIQLYNHMPETHCCRFQVMWQGLMRNHLSGFVCDEHKVSKRVKSWLNEGNTSSCIREEGYEFT